MARDDKQRGMREGENILRTREGCYLGACCCHNWEVLVVFRF